MGTHGRVKVGSEGRKPLSEHKRKVASLVDFEIKEQERLMRMYQRTLHKNKKLKREGRKDDGFKPTLGISFTRKTHRSSIAGPSTTAARRQSTTTSSHSGSNNSNEIAQQLEADIRFAKSLLQQEAKVETRVTRSRAQKDGNQILSINPIVADAGGKSAGQTATPKARRLRKGKEALNFMSTPKENQCPTTSELCAHTDKSTVSQGWKRSGHTVTIDTKTETGETFSDCCSFGENQSFSEAGPAVHAERQDETNHSVFTKTNDEPTEATRVCNDAPIDVPTDTNPAETGVVVTICTETEESQSISLFDNDDQSESSVHVTPKKEQMQTSQEQATPTPATKVKSLKITSPSIASVGSSTHKDSSSNRPLSHRPAYCDHSAIDSALEVESEPNCKWIIGNEAPISHVDTIVCDAVPRNIAISPSNSDMLAVTSGSDLVIWSMQKDSLIGSEANPNFGTWSSQQLFSCTGPGEEVKLIQFSESGNVLYVGGHFLSSSLESERKVQPAVLIFGVSNGHWEKLQELQGKDISSRKFCCMILVAYPGPKRALIVASFAEAAFENIFDIWTSSKEHIRKEDDLCKTCKWMNVQPIQSLVEVKHSNGLVLGATTWQLVLLNSIDGARIASFDVGHGTELNPLVILSAFSANKEGTGLLVTICNVDIEFGPSLQENVKQMVLRREGEIPASESVVDLKVFDFRTKTECSTKCVDCEAYCSRISVATSIPGRLGGYMAFGNFSGRVTIFRQFSLAADGRNPANASPRCVAAFQLKSLDRIINIVSSAHTHTVLASAGKSIYIFKTVRLS